MHRGAIQQSRLVAIALYAIVLMCSRIAGAQQCDGASVGTCTLTCDECSQADPNGHPHCSFSGNVQLSTQPASKVIRRIGLIPIENNRRDGDGNLFKYRCWAELASGRTIQIYDVVL